MCTVTAFAANDSSLLITMNRDERRQRHETGLYQDGAMAYPVDGESGGTWCGINSDGIAMALLNRYQDVVPHSASEVLLSRGGIIPMLLSEKKIVSAVSALRGFDIARYDAFTLLMYSQAHCCQCVWDGQALSASDLSPQPWSMSTSTSLRQGEILALRNQRFSAWIQNAEVQFGTIPALHLDQSGWDKSEAILMDRPISHTKSICQLALQAGSARLNYFNQQSLADLRDNASLRPTDSASLS